MDSLQGWLLAALAAVAIAAVVVTLRPDDAHHLPLSASARPSPPAESPGQPAKSTGPAKSPKQPSRPASEGSTRAGRKQQAKAYARAVNLRPSDLPYLRVIPEKDRDHAKQIREDREFRRCVGVSASEADRILHVPSPTLGAESSGVFQRYQSGVEVLSSAALAAKRSAAYRTSRTRDCLERFMSRVLGRADTGSAEYGQIHVSRLPTPLPGVEGSFGYRIAAHLTVRGESSELTAYHPESRPVVERTVPIYFDILVFISGSAEVNLDAIGAPRPIPASVERNLLRLLHRRAVAHQP